MTILFRTTQNGHRIAYQHQPGEGRGVLFCGGYRSSMESTKATALADWCAARSIPYTRFDYFAHGASDGEFIDYTIGAAIADTLEIIDHIAAEQLIVVGSSMGSWVGMQAAIQRPMQVKAFVGIASAPDFTDRLMLKKFPPALRKQLEDEGVVYLPDFDDNEYPVTMKFITEARRHLMLDHPIPLSIPVQLIQGQRDDDVPWETSLHIAEKLTGDDVAITFVKDGDHRLNRPQDLALMLEAVVRQLAV